jgi:hypothetical protein
MESKCIGSDAADDVNLLTENIGKYCAEWHRNSSGQ